ncbi:hypothetical protein [Chryseobacterium sp. A321]
MEPMNKPTQKSKNKPPAGYLIALAIIVGLIVFYFVLSAIFPELFEDLSQGKEVALLKSQVFFSSI